MKKVLVFGASGQLGQCLKQVAESWQMTGVSFPEKAIADVIDRVKLQALFESERPDYVINCAAYTAVDKAEEEAEMARRINRDGAANLAEFCRANQSVLIHVSTDFVFKGDIARALTEEDPAEPINMYGLTKLEGEQAISGLLKEHFILRTSWLYSEYGNNFVKTMLRLGGSLPELRVIADQVGTPTYAVDLATCILEIIRQELKAYGTYHYSNEGVCSWYDFAQAVFDLSESQVRVVPIKTSEYVTKAVRPAFSVMDKTKIKSNLKLEIPYWRDSLACCMQRLEK